MRKVAIVAVTAALAGAVVGGGSLATAGDQSGGGLTLTFHATTVQEQDVDLGPRGESVGDRFTLRDVLRDSSGQRAGSLYIDCVVSELVSRQSFGFRCNVTALLRHGQIEVGGAVRFTGEEARPFTLSVTGGTGRYTGAEGTVTVLETGQTTSTITFHLIG